MAKNQKLKLSSWYSSKYQMVVLQRNILFLISFLTIISVLVSIVIVRQVMASKSLVPYVIEIEEKSGIPTIVEQLDESHFTADVSLKRYFIYSFLSAAEGYNPGTFREDYKKLSLFSTPDVFRKIQAKINPRNPKSPAALIGNRGIIEVAIKSLIFKTANSATIIFRLKNIGSVSGFANNRDMIADIEFKFTNLTLSQQDRYINPIGFQVTKFLADLEISSNYGEAQ